MSCQIQKQPSEQGLKQTFSFLLSVPVSGSSPASFFARFCCISHGRPTLNALHFSVFPDKVTDPALQHAYWFLSNPLGCGYDLEDSDA